MQDFLLFAVLVLLLGGRVVAYDLVKPIHPDRYTFIKNLVEWCSLSLDGELGEGSTDDKKKEVTEKLHYLHHRLAVKYSQDDNYKAFFIAYKDGVIPKSVKFEGMDCDPKYESWYKNPHNGLVTWEGIKNFTFSTYWTKDEPYIFCDFRRGLVCSPTEKKCRCRPDTTYDIVVELGDPWKRCLIDKDKPCALHDLSTHTSIRYSDEFIAHMIFNPEKPEGCRPGIQCRLGMEPRTEDHKEVSTCAKYGEHPGWLRTKKLPIGSPCSLGAAHDPNKGLGRCHPDYGAKFPGGEGVQLECYSFEATFQRQGFCAHPLGSYQIRLFWKGSPYKDYDHWSTNNVMGFVNRRTVDFDQKELAKYYEEYLKDVYPKMYFSKGKSEEKELLLSTKAGQPCNETITKEMKKIWDFYAGILQKKPTRRDLNSKLWVMKNLVRRESHFCRVFWSYDSSGNPLDPLVCDTSQSPPYGTGNDGVCKIDPAGSADTAGKDFAKKVQDITEYIKKQKEKDEQDTQKQNEVYKNHPDKDPATCSEFEIGGDCPSDKYMCFKDYRDLKNGMYGPAPDCELLRQPDPTLWCRELSQKPEEKCEKAQLDRMLKELAGQIKGTLTRDQECDDELEGKVRDLSGTIYEDDKYNLYAYIKKAVGNTRLCDRTRLLRCIERYGRATCQCDYGSSYRSVEISGEWYYSDYCYKDSGPCDQNLAEQGRFTGEEKEAVKDHYGEPDENCDGGNVCLFVDKEKKECTKEDKGDTGYDGTLPWPPVPTTAPDNTGDENENGPGGGNTGAKGKADRRRVATQMIVIVASVMKYLLF